MARTAELEERRRILDLPDPEAPKPVPVPRGGQLQPDGTRRRAYHPGRGEELLEYARAALAALRDPERVTMTNGRVEWVGEPARPPSLHGYATAIGVSRNAITRWQQRHHEFAQAVGRARSIIATWWTDSAALRIVDWRLAQFVLRCGDHPDYQEPTQRLDVGVGPRVVPIPAGTFPEGTTVVDVTPDDPRVTALLEAGDDE